MDNITKWMVRGACGAVLLSAPVSAQLNHTGRYYRPNGSYIKCRTVGTYEDFSTFCMSGEDAHDEDRRHDLKNTCIKQVDESYEAKYGNLIAESQSEYGLLGSYSSERNPDVSLYDSDWYRRKVGLIGPSPIEHKKLLQKKFLLDNPLYAEYKARSEKCFTENGFN